MPRSAALWDGFARAGRMVRRYNTSNGISTSVRGFTVDYSEVADNESSGEMPTSCYIHSIVVEYDTDSSLGTCDIQITRDAAGDIVLVGDGPTGATQAKSPGKTTATEGAFIWLIQQDIHTEVDGHETVSTNDVFDTGYPSSESSDKHYRKIYVWLTTSAGTANVRKITINWRNSRGG